MRALVIAFALTACETGGDSPTLPDADLTKPDATGAVGKCNNRGICKPAAANACHP